MDRYDRFCDYALEHWARHYVVAVAVGLVVFITLLVLYLMKGA